MKNFSRYQLPLLIWAVIIFCLSSITTFPHVETPFIAEDKLAHMTVFFIFCLFCRRALFFQTALPFLKRWSLIGAFVLSCIYGYSDEVHQLFVPGRMYDYFDMIADALGALLFVIFFIASKSWKGRQAIRS